MWYDLGQHQYMLYASALIKHYEMRDRGFKTRVIFKQGSHCVQIWE